jgi:hypothetical protein
MSKWEKSTISRRGIYLHVYSFGFEAFFLCFLSNRCDFLSRKTDFRCRIGLFWGPVLTRTGLTSQKDLKPAIGPWNERYFSGCNQIIMILRYIRLLAVPTHQFQTLENKRKKRAKCLLCATSSSTENKTGFWCFSNADLFFLVSRRYFGETFGPHAGATEIKNN